MTTFYNHQQIEGKWQQIWEKSKADQAKDNFKLAKKYLLVMWPYPSGEGLHVGHPESYTACDIVARYSRLKGFNVLQPMGWDAFGLPAENYAIKSGISPKETTLKAIATFKRQIKSLGLSYDWSRETSSADPEYYKWTQWIFLKLYQQGLAYKKKAPVNWCDSCKTVLANEQVVEGRCERCGQQVIQKDLEQWFFKITKYADELLKQIDQLDWSEALKTTQRNWIGKSEGALIKFQISSTKSQTNPNDQNFNKVALIHGKDVDAKGKKWYVWLSELLKEKGVNFVAPNLPQAHNPVLEEWLQEINKIKPDENTVLIGHSRGGVAILRWLERLESPLKVGKVILVATNSGDSEKGGSFYADGKYNYEKIKQHCDNFAVIHSKDDERVNFKAGEENTNGLNAIFYQLDNRGHFGRKIVDLPELRQELFNDHEIEVFTTRPDTLYGATYMVLAPEHPMIEDMKSIITNWPEVEQYINQAKTKNQLERTDLAKEKTGVELKGVKAINPGTKEEIPVWIADYVLMGYGTGAIMAVPAHDERDWEFAKKFNLEIKKVIIPLFKTTSGSDALRADKKMVLRKNVFAFVKHWSENKYLCLNWKKYNWHTTIIGGINDQESVAEAAIREIREESGYQNIKIIKELEDQVQNQSFAAHKDENRHGIGYVVLTQLENDQRLATNKEDTRHHDLVWVEENQMLSFLNLENIKFMWRLLTEKEVAYTGEGVIVGSADKFNGLSSEPARDKITRLVKGKKHIQYKIRDWLVSRQRYWGAPIPIIYCPKCGMVPVPEKDLPVLLPDDVDFKPTGESPLARSKKFHQVKCPKCGAPAKRESDTLDTFVCSAWYFLRYCDPHNNKEPFSKKSANYWLPIDLYIGGLEHAVGHLIYARFITKALRDLGYLKIDEPFPRMRNQGIVLAEDGRKMSKRWHNVINPDEVVEQYGADTMRLYEMFMGPLEDHKPWSRQGIMGIRRFLERVYKLITSLNFVGQPQSANERKLHRTIKKVTEDIKNLKFNTAIAALMELVNQFTADQQLTKNQAEKFLLILAPLAPHLAEELWSSFATTFVKTSVVKKASDDQDNKYKKSIFLQSWPKFDSKLVIDEQVTIAVQINGKLRTTLQAGRGIAEKELRDQLLVLPQVIKHLQGKEVKKFIYIKDKLINLVV